ncbi:P325-like protein [Cotesia vestalis bracovirus]|nr:P325-like protein [Cotesia vestalis bracovirus]
MVYTKTSTFLFFLIIGTSGSSGTKLPQSEKNTAASMLYIAVVTLLFTHNGISRIYAEETVEQKANLYRRKIPMNVMHQEQPFQSQIFNDGRDIVLGSQIYQNDMTFIVDANPPNNRFGAYTNHVNQKFKFVGNQNQTQPNKVNIRYGSSNVQINNRYITRKGAKNSSGPRGYQSGYSKPEIIAQTEKKAQNNIESQAHSAKFNSSSKQLSSSFNTFCYYFLIVFFRYYLF